MLELGFPYFSIDDFRTESIRALEHLWPANERSAGIARLRRLWIRLDAGRTLATRDQADLNELSKRLALYWAPLDEMAAANSKFLQSAPKFAASMMLDGWTGLPVRFARAGELVPLATLDRLAEVLSQMERKLRPPREPGTTFTEVCAAALIRINAAAAKR